MRVFLAEIDGPFMDVMPGHFRRLAGHSAVNEVVSDPKAADVVLFAQPNMLPQDWSLRTIRRHPVRLQFPEKCFVYDERDLAWCAFPGLYVSVGSRRSQFQQVAPYVWIRDAEFVELRDTERSLLFSFVGSRTHRCRNGILDLRHDQGVVRDTTGFVYYDTEHPKYIERRSEYLDILGRSTFSLCPRGHGVSTIRFYESLAAGCIPVVIADDWEPPGGIDWEGTFLRFPENGVGGLIEFLEAQQSVADRVARCIQTYDRHFVEERRFDYLMDRLQLVRYVRRRFPTTGVLDRQFAQIAARAARARARALVASLRGASR